MMMINKRMLLIGKGHLGAYLQELWKIPDELVWAREMAELDEATLKRLHPEVVLNTAAQTDLPWCEANALEAFRCNVSAPIGVYRVVKKAFNNNVPYIHLSSGCVWDGPFRPDGKPFQPTDPPTPACFYSWTKAACDALLLAEAAAPVLLLRPRQLYSPIKSPRNTLSKINSYPKLLDTPNSMTSVSTIVKAIETVLSSTDRRCWNRIMNVYERGYSSPFEVGTFLAQASCRQPPEKLTKSDLDSWHKPKRVDAVIEDQFFEALVKPPTVQDELKRNIALYAKAIRA